MGNATHQPVPVAGPGCRWSLLVPLGFTLATGLLLHPLEALAQAASEDPIVRIRERATQTRTDAVRIWRRGTPLLVFDAPDAPPEFTPQSIVKPITALAVLRLIDDGKLDSLDQPLYTLYPEWRQGRKKLITIRHILTHTSGLQDAGNVQAELVHMPDRVQAALAAEMQEDPGTRWRYNNKAYWLVGGLIERAAGERAEDYIARSLFEPLGITKVRWTYDPSGRNLGVTGGLYLRPDDLARVGQLVLDEGTFNGQQVISRALMQQAVAPQVPIGRGINSMGLGWMVGRKTVRVTFGDSALALLANVSVDSAFRARAEQLRGSYGDWAAFEDKVELVYGDRNAFGDVAQQLPGLWGAILTETEEVPSYVFHSGDGGQFLYIVPARNIVALRLVRDHFRDVLSSPQFRDKDTSNPEINEELGRRYNALVRETGFGDFGALVLRIP
jgi:CubicO group peptidase (beta-lactamase class C family)